MTFTVSGLYHILKARDDMAVLDPFDKSLTPEQLIEIRRKSLLVDLFVTGTNAVTEDGQLVNLDMFGNRVGGLTFGPNHVVVLAGRNKIVPDLEEAMVRIKDFAAPANAMRLDKKTPCVKTAYCHECSSPDRICNTWTITEKSYPKNRVKIVLINQDLGL
jgi:L-lactate utilization protein LutB